MEKIWKRALKKRDIFHSAGSKNVDPGLQLCMCEWKAFVLDEQQKEPCLKMGHYKHPNNIWPPRTRHLSGCWVFFSVKAFPMKWNLSVSTHTQTHSNNERFPVYSQESVRFGVSTYVHVCPRSFCGYIPVVLRSSWVSL